MLKKRDKWTERETKGCGRTEKNWIVFKGSYEVGWGLTLAGGSRAMAALWRRRFKLEFRLVAGYVLREERPHRVWNLPERSAQLERSGPVFSAPAASSSPSAPRHQPSVAATRPKCLELAQLPEQPEYRATDDDASEAAEQSSNVAATATNGQREKRAQSDASIVHQGEDSREHGVVPSTDSSSVSPATASSNRQLEPIWKTKVSWVREDLFEQFEPQATHRERAHSSNRVRLLSRVQQAVQDETIPPDTPSVDAWYPETEKLPVVSDADADTTATIVRWPSVWRPAIAATICGTGKMVERGQTVIGTRVLRIVDRSKNWRDTRVSLGRCLGLKREGSMRVDAGNLYSWP